MTGRIVVLNGPPRSGKSSIAKAVQQHVPGHWLNIGVDVMAAALPPSLQPGIGLRPGGERPDLEPHVEALFLALYDTIASHARLGFDVVADLAHHDHYARSLGILPKCARRISGLSALLVSIECPDEVILARRRADTSGGFYSLDPSRTAAWREALAAGPQPDLVIDTAHTTPAAAAQRVADRLAALGPDSAFARIALEEA